MSEPNARDWYGSLIGLQFAIAEVAGELTVDTCEQHPRIVCMAIQGLAGKADALVKQIQGAMKEPQQ